MNENDKKTMIELVNKYGYKKVLWMLEVNKQFLDYMNNQDSIIANRNKNIKLCNETDNGQLFINGRTSVFYLNDKILDFDILKSNELEQKYTYADEDEIKKYFNRAQQLFGSAETITTIKEGYVLPFINKIDGSIETMSLNEYKLIHLLLDEAKIYTSRKHSIIYAESKKGYAYVLTKASGSQSQLVLY